MITKQARNRLHLPLLCRSAHICNPEPETEGLNCQSEKPLPVVLPPNAILTCTECLWAGWRQRLDKVLFFGNGLSEWDDGDFMAFVAEVRDRILSLN